MGKNVARGGSIRAGLRNRDTGDEVREISSDVKAKPASDSDRGSSNGGVRRARRVNK